MILDHNVEMVDTLIGQFNFSNQPIVLRSSSGYFFLINLHKNGSVFVSTNTSCNGVKIESTTFQNSQEVHPDNLSDADLLELMQSQDKCYQIILKVLCLKHYQIEKKVKSFNNFK